MAHAHPAARAAGRLRPGGGRGPVSGEAPRRRAWQARTSTPPLRPDALTIGFARRFATYKRATLLFRDVARLKAILQNEARPVQLLLSGKAHPRDGAGKEFIREMLDVVKREGLSDSVVFLEDYDLSKAAMLVQGVDVWLNTPRRPYEASGTSGMKVVPNGGLNLSVLDGWWAEAYRPGSRLGHRHRAGIGPSRPIRTSSTPSLSTRSSRTRSCRCSTPATPTGCPAGGSP